MVKHIINGCPINLRTLSEDDIRRLISEGADRFDRLQEEMDSLHGELVRRSHNVIPLFGTADAPSYLLDPA